MNLNMNSVTELKDTVEMMNSADYKERFKVRAAYVRRCTKCGKELKCFHTMDTP